MISTHSFLELSIDESYLINGGGTLGNSLIFVGGVCIAVGGCVCEAPLVIAVGVYVAILGLCQAQGW